jgi:hypothetical protein
MSSSGRISVYKTLDVLGKTTDIIIRGDYIFTYIQVPDWSIRQWHLKTPKEHISFSDVLPDGAIEFEVPGWKGSVLSNPDRSTVMVDEGGSNVIKVFEEGSTNCGDMVEWEEVKRYNTCIDAEFRAQFDMYCRYFAIGSDPEYEKSGHLVPRAPQYT